MQGVWCVVVACVKDASRVRQGCKGSSLYINELCGAPGWRSPAWRSAPEPDRSRAASAEAQRRRGADTVSLCRSVGRGWCTAG